MQYSAKDLAEAMKRRRLSAPELAQILAAEEEAAGEEEGMSEKAQLEEEMEGVENGLEKTPSGDMTPTPELAAKEEVEGAEDDEFSAQKMIEALLGSEGRGNPLRQRAREALAMKMKKNA